MSGTVIHQSTCRLSERDRSSDMSEPYIAHGVKLSKQDPDRCDA